MPSAPTQEPEASLPPSSSAPAEGRKHHQQQQHQRQPPHHPGPLEELEFWEQKAADLNGIFSQLQSSRVRKILRYLDHRKSTYSTPFAKLCKEAFLARSEANDTKKYLRPLRPWLQRIDAEISLENLPVLFRPALHMLLLVWKSSGYYNTSTRLVVFVREVGASYVTSSSGCLLVSLMLSASLLVAGEAVGQFPVVAEPRLPSKGRGTSVEPDWNVRLFPREQREGEHHKVQTFFAETASE